MNWATSPLYPQFTRVFVLCTGRCGSKTLAAALKHVEGGWTVGHETNINRYRDRLDYPANHIEIDNRLAWFLGTMWHLYDPRRTLYVHLRRNPDQVARSYADRVGISKGLMRAFASGVILTRLNPSKIGDASRLMVDTIEDNIDMFLSDKPFTVSLELEHIDVTFPILWQALCQDPARLPIALKEFETVRR